MPLSHTVKPGESVALLADRYGFAPDTIWNHGANKTLRSKRSNMNALVPGDSVAIPDKTQDSHDCATDARHRFQLKGVPMLFKLQLVAPEGPRANKPYMLTVDGREFRGNTDKDGGIKRYIPNSAQQGTLVVGDEEVSVQLDFGYLEAIESPQGVRKRLRNMGFRSDDAIAEFQQFLG